MFGYLTVNQDELKIKDDKVYRAWYCGLCENLKKYHGQLSRLSLTYDMTFLALLLQGVYEETVTRKESRCLLHPFKKHNVLESKASAYAADMNVLLCYYDFLDDWKDEKKLTGLFMAKVLKRKVTRLKKKYPRQSQAIDRYMKALGACENEKSQEIDRASGLTGQLMAEIFVWREDPFAENIRRIGFNMGKFIYLMDAFEDVDADKASGSYNPFTGWSEAENFTERVHQALILIASDAARAFEKLPVEQNLDILRNILYCGIWSKYWNIIQKKENEK